VRAAFLTLATLALLAAPDAGASPVRCQRTIEQRSHRYMQVVLAVAERCAGAGDAGAVSDCLFTELAADPALAAERARWARLVARRCRDTTPAALAYHSSCAGGGDSPCRFPTPVFDAPGEDDDVIDCLACQMGQQVRGMTVKLFQGEREWTGAADPRRACVEGIGRPGLAAFRTLDRELYRCLRRRRSPSIAACLEDRRVAERLEAAMTVWRSGAVAACAGLDPTSIPGGVFGYSNLCTGPVGFPGQACRSVAPACTLPSTTKLDAPGAEDDVLDCLRCRVEEAGLAVARGVQGANLCCTDGRCDMVTSRSFCARAQRSPAYYRIDDGAVPGFRLPHGIAFAPDGTMYVADQDDTQTPYVATVAPDGTQTVLATIPGPGVPTGIALDAARNAYVPIPCGVHSAVYRVTPAGTVSVFAGTPGVAGHAGDGGPADAALLAVPRKAVVDAAGNVYVTESGFLTLGCPANGIVSGAEDVRMIDPDGIIHTVAGAGPFGAGGEGGPALQAQLAGLLSIGLAPDGSMLLGEGGLQRLLRISPLPPAGVVERVAGRTTGPFGTYSGDGGPARLARFFDIEGVVQDADGNVILSDFQNNRIRLVDPAGSVITIAGNGVTSGPPGSGSGDGGPAELAFLGCPQDGTLAPDGRFWFHNQLGARYFRTLTRVSF
jgi:hypothetical protein